jgi:hypothetical protein
MAAADIDDRAREGKSIASRGPGRRGGAPLASPPRPVATKTPIAGYSSSPVPIVALVVTCPVVSGVAAVDPFGGGGRVLARRRS